MMLESICRSAMNAARAAGDFALNEISEITPDKVKQKAHRDLVTYVDHASERRIIADLTKLLPDSGFITEEQTVANENRELTWIIDPLDGTTNYVHGIPIFSVSIALMQRGKVILGVIYVPALDECFHSYQGGGVFLNNKPIRVSETHSLGDAIITTGFPCEDLPDLDRHMELLKVFISHSHGIRRMGSAAIDLAYVACGRFDAMFETGLNPWDIAAGTFILRQAGGEVTDYTGGTGYLFNKELIACNKALFPRFFDLTHSYLVGRQIV
jgi:myo-inositol-1(or 4)-monophosphatase